MTLDRKKDRVNNCSFGENRHMKDIYIFDIDGCIMPNRFQNFTEAMDLSENLNHIIKDKITNLSLFPEFLEFFKLNCVKSSAIYFITGRKQKEYGKITERQLGPLKKYKNFLLKFYPDDKPYIKKEYFNWKYNTITRIIEYHHNDFENIHIYDDFEDVIFKLREISTLNHKIHCNLIQKQRDWIIEQIPIP